MITYNKKRFSRQAVLEQLNADEQTQAKRWGFDLGTGTAQFGKLTPREERLIQYGILCGIQDIAEFVRSGN